MRLHQALNAPVAGAGHVSERDEGPDGSRCQGKGSPFATRAGIWRRDNVSLNRAAKKQFLVLSPSGKYNADWAQRRTKAS